MNFFFLNARLNSLYSGGIQKITKKNFRKDILHYYINYCITTLKLEYLNNIVNTKIKTLKGYV